jgi:hypothetical protein
MVDAGSGQLPVKSRHEIAKDKYVLTDITGAFGIQTCDGGVTTDALESGHVLVECRQVPTVPLESSQVLVKSKQVLASEVQVRDCGV